MLILASLGGGALFDFSSVEFSARVNAMAGLIPAAIVATTVLKSCPSSNLLSRQTRITGFTAAGLLVFVAHGATIEALIGAAICVNHPKPYQG